MTWALGDMFTKHMQRTEPGPGAAVEDDNVPGNSIKMRSIPNVPTGRLERVLDHSHHMIHTTEGLSEFDQPKRTLVETGVKLRAVTHELRLRGQEPGECKHCWGSS